MALYRLPLTSEPGQTTWLEDVDLPALLVQAGGTPDVSSLQALDAARRPLAVQWLSSGQPSRVRGHTCGTLIVAPAREPVALFARTAEGRALADPPAVSIKETDEALEVTVADKPFFTYRFNTKDPEVPRPYFHPLMGPTGKVVTQMGEIPGQKKAHFHHTALWIAHQKFTPKGEPVCDNWQIGGPRSRMRHVKFDAVESGPLAARFVERLDWLNVKGDKTVLTETRTVTVPKRPVEARVLDIEIVLTGQAVPVTLEKTPYHLLAVRVLDALLPKAGGAIVNSTGKKNPPDGAAAKWIDISGRLDDAAMGVALFDHPDNLRHPPPCLNFAGQTIGLSLTHAEPYTIEPEKTLKLRYRVLVHAGDAEAAKVADEYEAFVKKASSRLGQPRQMG